MQQEEEVSTKLFNIGQQKRAFEEQLRLLKKIKYKLNSQMRHFKQMNYLRMMVSKSDKFIKNIENLQKITIKQIDSYEIQFYDKIQLDLKKRIIGMGKMAEQFIKKGFLLQFAVLIFGISSKLYCIYQKINKKVQIVSRIKRQRKNKPKNKAAHK